VSAGIRELNSSTMVRVRPRHRGQYVIATLGRLVWMLKPQQGQLR
jgi:hypothetical protein